MTAASVRAPRSLTIPLSASLVLHVAVIAAFVFIKTGDNGPPMPPVYRVRLIAAPAGARAIGAVNPPKVAEEKPTPPKARTVAPTPSAKKTPAPKVTKATATPAKPETKAAPAAALPKAGGGPEGGKGTDVANVDLQGLVFPFEPYLQNIVNQIMSRFQWTGSQTQTAQIAFMIMRDGSVTMIRPVNANASLPFKLAAQAAIEAAGKVKAFGALPAEFSDDVLPVVFSFDPKKIR